MDPISTPEPKKPTRARRTPKTERVDAEGLEARVLDARDRNIPIHIIAANLKISQHRVTKICERFYRRSKPWAAASLALKKTERVRQFEFMDSLLARILALNPTNPTALSGSGVSLREWLSALESSRRLKGDLIRLEGLIGVSSVNDPSEVQPGDPVDEARTVFRWIESFRGNPDAYESILRGMQAGTAPVDLPLPNEADTMTPDIEGMS